MNIDTLSIARDLKAVELPADQAEAIAAAIGRSLNDSAASKADVSALEIKLDALEGRLFARFDAIDAQLTAKIESVRSSLLMWLAGAIFAASGILIAVLKTI